MLKPIGNGENAVLLQKLANGQLLCGRVLDPTVGVRRQLQGRHVFVSLPFERFETHGPVPLLAPHSQEFLGRVRQQCHIAQKEDIRVTTKRRFFRKRRQAFLKFRSKMFERARCAISGVIQLLCIERCLGPQ